MFRLCQCGHPAVRHAGRVEWCAEGSCSCAQFRPAASGGAADGERECMCGKPEADPVHHRPQTSDEEHRYEPAPTEAEYYGAPAASQADGGLREEIVQAVRAELACGTAWYIPTGESIADTVLALPTVRQLLADAAKVQRVRKLADRLDRGGLLLHGELRHALDGDR